MTTGSDGGSSSDTVSVGFAFVRPLKSSATGALRPGAAAAENTLPNASKASALNGSALSCILCDSASFLAPNKRREIGRGSVHLRRVHPDDASRVRARITIGVGEMVLEEERIARIELVGR